MISNNPIAIDAGDLQYYDKQIKKYIDTKDAELSSSLSTFSGDIDKRVDTIAEKVSANEASIIAHEEMLDQIEQAKRKYYLDLGEDGYIHLYYEE